MRGHENEFGQCLRANAEWVSLAVFAGRLYRIDWYPGAVDGDSEVHGELYSFSSPDLLEKLDAYEECSPDFPEPHEYRREKRPVWLPDGQMVKAWIWLYNHSTANATFIPDGKFKR